MALIFLDLAQMSLLSENPLSLQSHIKVAFLTSPPANSNSTGIAYPSISPVEWTPWRTEAQKRSQGRGEQSRFSGNTSDVFLPNYLYLGSRKAQGQNLKGSRKE